MDDEEIQKIVDSLENTAKMIKTESDNLKQKLESKSTTVDELGLLKSLFPLWYHDLNDSEDILKKLLTKDHNYI